MYPQFEHSKRIKCNKPISPHNKTHRDSACEQRSCQQNSNFCQKDWRYLCDMGQFWINSWCNCGTGSVHSFGKGQNKS